MSAVAFDTVELFFSKSSLQSKPKYMRKNSTGLWLFLCTWMIMTNSIILPKAVFNWKYPTHPLSQLKMQRMRTYQKFVNLDSIVELGPTSFVDSCIYKVSRMFCINIVQPSLELEANNLDFCFEELFKKRAIVESRNFKNAKTFSSYQHIGLPYHWFRNKVSSLEIDIQAVSSADKLADQFTKGLFQEKFESSRKLTLCHVYSTVTSHA